MQASCSLQFVPWDAACEDGLTEKVGGDVIAFAVQKVQEIVALANAVPDIIAGKQVGFCFVSTPPLCPVLSTESTVVFCFRRSGSHEFPACPSYGRSGWLGSRCGRFFAGLEPREVRNARML